MYLGFGLVVAGASIAAGSATGLWLVTPVAALASAALYFGYERHDLRRRFGPNALARPLLSVPGPESGDEPPATWERIAVYIWVLAPWLLSWLALQALGPAPDAFGTDLSFEASWPVLEQTELLYLSAYVFVPATPLIIRSRRGLREFAWRGAIATTAITLLWLLIPVVSEPRPFEPSTLMGRVLAFEQRHSSGVAAFPAFHVVWPLIAAIAWQEIARLRRQPAWAIAGWSWAALITVSTLTTGMHTVVDVAAALLLLVPIWKYRETGRLVRLATERLANSWKEWRLGPVRIINHGVFAGAGAGAGLLVSAAVTGPGYEGTLLSIGIGILAGAALGAQVLEGSPRLLRPFAWYGGLLGGLAAALVSGPRRAGDLVVALAIAAPWIQILGRMRCIVQGCCHGGEAPNEWGIRYRHRRTRPVVIGGLAGVPLYPTQLWSILANLVIGAILIRLRLLGAAAPLIVGGYLMLAGLARFVEEAYRGEPQTPVWAGLKVYQWLAIGSVLAGIVGTTLPASRSEAGFTWPTAAAWGAALAAALIAWFAMGVDFPRLDRRFSRLAPAD